MVPLPVDSDSPPNEIEVRPPAADDLRASQTGSFHQQDSGRSCPSAAARIRRSSSRLGR